MSFNLVKVVRVRPSNPSINERLSITSFNNVYKGAISDIRVELYESNRKYKISWIPIVQTGGNAGYPTEYNKSDFEEFGTFEAYDKVIEKQMISDAARRISLSGLKGVDSGTYYTVVQDPWQDEPPLLRNYGFDPYYLNNGAEVTVHWYNYDNGVVNYSGGLLWSNVDGTELSEFDYSTKTSTNVNKSSIVKNIEVYYKDTDERLMFSDNQIKKKSSNYKDEQNFTGNITDIDIIETFITTWKNAVPNYDLKICTPSHYPSVISLNYISPIETLPETTPEPEPDNSTPATDIVGDKDFKISVVFDKSQKIKAKRDFNGLEIYIGEPPKEGEVQLSDEFDDLTLLDPEYQEVKFQGDGENIVTVEEGIANQKEAESNGGTQLSMPQGTYNVSNIEPDTPFDASQLPVPPGFNGVPLYFQYDKRWGDIRYGVGKKMTCVVDAKGGTIALSGCMPSSLSMMINYWAKKGYCKPTRPDIVGQFCVDYGGRVCGNGGNLTLIPADKFKEVFGLNIVAFSNIGDDKVRTLLKKGFPVNHGGATTGRTAKGNSKSYGGHYLCMTGIDDKGRIRVNDSGNGPMGGKAITYYESDKWSSANTRATSQSYLYPDALGDPLK
jgi:hypothetical protein